MLRWPDSVVVRGDIQTGEKSGWPLHMMSFARAEAIVLTSGGSTNRGQSIETDRAKLASQGPGQVWTFHSPYVLRRWDNNLRVAQTLEREPGWWRDPETGLPYGIPHRSPPASSVAAVAVDSVGLIWVFIHVAAPNWREGWADVPPGASEIPAKLVRRERLFNSIVEVIDPGTMRVVTRSRLPHYVLQAFSDRTVAVYAPTPEGAPRADILQLTLSGFARR